MITNVAGATTSAVASVTVIAPPSIVTQPTNATVIAGAPVSFLAEAAGTAPLSYQWYFNTTNAVGTNGPAFGLASAQATNEGTYQLVVSNVAGMATSSVASLTVTGAANCYSATNEPERRSRSQYYLAAAATGTAPLSYQWQHQGTNLASGTTNTLALLNVQTNDAGAYRVVITNVAGATTSSVASLNVIVPPSIVTQPTNATVIAGAPVLIPR